jgi:hypothetical protein
MIPKWRYVEYTDDGCGKYQCLNCYQTWEGRTWPGYMSIEGAFTAVWKHCPYCGCQWTGATRTNDDDGYNARRKRIRAAEDARRFEDRPLPPYWWVIECQTTTTWLLGEKKTTVGAWASHVWLPWWLNAVKIKKALVQEREKRWDEGDNEYCIVHKAYRARTVRSQPGQWHNIAWWAYQL